MKISNDNNIMLDLETMGTGPNAAIVAIGAVAFSKEGLGREFYQTVSLESSEHTSDIDASTVIWWMKQSSRARSEIFNAKSTLNDALHQFAAYLPDDAIIWGNGSDFDNIILSNAYKNCLIPQPWSYRNNRCYRTVIAMNKELNIKRLGTHHNALDDAIYQANYLSGLGVFL